MAEWLPSQRSKQNEELYMRRTNRWNQHTTYVNGDSREREAEWEWEQACWERAGCSMSLDRGAVASIVRQVLHVHVTSTWDWMPTESIHAGGVVSPSVGDILPKRALNLFRFVLQLNIFGPMTRSFSTLSTLVNQS